MGSTAAACRTGQEDLLPAVECSSSSRWFAAQELSVSLYSCGLLLPTKWPDMTVVGVDREHGAIFNCVCSRAGRTARGNACFSSKMASVGKLLSESPPGHKPWRSVSHPLPFMRERLLESHPNFHHFQSEKHCALIHAVHLKIPSILEHSYTWKLIIWSPAMGMSWGQCTSFLCHLGRKEYAYSVWRWCHSLFLSYIVLWALRNTDAALYTSECEDKHRLVGHAFDARCGSLPFEKLWLYSLSCWKTEF